MGVVVIAIKSDDFLDPNNWLPDEHEHRIYATDDLEVYVVVDAVDYPWLVQWKWTIHNRAYYERTGQLYLKRTVTEVIAPEGPRYESPLSGKLVRNFHRIQRTRFLHQEIMERTGIPRPTPKHKEVDHINKKTINCRRYNLQWATRSMQVASSNLGTVRGAARVHAKSRKNVRASGPDGPSRRDGGL